MAQCPPTKYASDSITYYKNFVVTLSNKDPYGILNCKLEDSTFTGFLVFLALNFFRCLEGVKHPANLRSLQ